MNRILSIDPSGTGTSGICFINGKEKPTFISYKEKEWKKHYDFIAGLVKSFHPDILLYEHTNFINSRGKDMTSLLKLLGALETLSLPCSTRPKINTVPADQVKGLKGKLLNGSKIIAGLEFKKGRGKGWSLNNVQISPHVLDAYLVYWLWKDKEKPSLLKKYRRD